MPKESFEQFVKRQKEKLEKAKRIVEEVKGKWKEELKKFEFEMVEKSAEELKKLWKENEREAYTKNTNNTFSFFFSLPLPEVPSFLLEKISNKFLKEFDWKKFKERKYTGIDLGLFLSAFLKKNIENYISSQKQKGIKEENIKPIEVHLDVKELPVTLGCLGYQNPQKLYLSVEGNLRYFTGAKMEGGEIIVKGNCGSWTGDKMKGGVLILEGEVKSFAESAFFYDNKGTIIWKNIKIWENGDWTKEGREMREKDKIPIWI